MSISPAQCRAARALLGKNQVWLCKKADVSQPTLVAFETGARIPGEDTLAAIAGALDQAGAEFIPENGAGAGVRLKKKAQR